MKNRLKFASIIVVLLFFFIGCAGSSNYMRLVPDQQASYLPGEDESVIIFMRPQTLGFAIQSTVFDISTDENMLVGIVSAKKKVAFKTRPGKHLFMVVGENADFMKADLDAGKTYYALVHPRMGVWKARFSLGPVSKNVNQKQLDSWLTTCKYTENTDGSYKWAEQHASNIQKMRVGYMKKWNSRPDSSKPMLNPEDGF